MGEARASRLVALGALALAVASGLWQLPTAFREVYDEVQALRSESPLERRFGGARRVDLDTRVFVEAERLIPADARFAVVTGPNVQVSNPVTLHAVAPYAGDWLLPRRRVLEAAHADWVISYGGDLESLGVRLARVVEVAPGIHVAEVRR